MQKKEISTKIALTCSGSCGRNDNFDMNTLWTTDEDVRSLKSLIRFWDSWNGCICISCKCAWIYR